MKLFRPIQTDIAPFVHLH